MTKKKDLFLSVVVPVYNEQEVLPAFHARLSAVLDILDKPCEILYVDDGSKDQTWLVLQALQQKDSRVALIALSRNFGKEVAVTAGLDHAQGDGVVLIDADLQDPPEVIPQLIEKWQSGYDVVYGQYTKRQGESWLKKITARCFYRVIQQVSTVDVPSDASDFRLLSRRAVDALKQITERHRFMKGLFAWIGYPQAGVSYQRAARFAGQTKWNYWKLWNFAIEGITSFTITPLKIATYFGLFTALAAFICAVVIIAKTLMFGNPVKGYASLMTVILFLGGVQLMTLGIIGEYLGRMFNETKNRPLYLLKQYTPGQSRRKTPAPRQQSIEI